MRGRARTIFDLPLGRLAGHFHAEAVETYIHVPETLFDQYLNLYGHARRLHHKLVQVISDESHARLLEEGKGKFNLPPRNHLQAENDRLGKALAFNPYERNTGIDGMVLVRLTEIKGLFDVFARGKDVVHGLDTVFSETDYIKFHRYRRDELGKQYEGPKSYNEWLAVKWRLKTVSDACIELARSHGLDGRAPVYLMGM